MLTTSAGASVFDVSGTTPVLLGTVPVVEEGAAQLWEDRLLVWEDFRTVVLYDLGTGAPVEVTRREDDPLVQETVWDPVVAGVR